MIWLAWRQQRVPILVALTLITICAGVATYIGIDAGSTSAGCTGLECPEAGRGYVFVAAIWPPFLMLVSLAIGGLTGAPLFAGEAEKGTHILALTQSVSRMRWWATKLAVGAVPITVAMLGLGLLNQWAFERAFPEWLSPLLTPIFDSSGIVLAAYTLFAFTVAAVIGSALKHSIAAMSITLAAFLVVMTVGSISRPYYAEPEHDTQAIDTGEFGQSPPGALPMGEFFTDAAGNDVSDHVLMCMRTGCQEEIVAVSSTVHYHPADRYWPFQAVDAGALVLLSLVVTACGARVVRTRYTR